MGDLIRKTNFGNRWMNEDKHLYSLGHRGMKGTIRMKKVVLPSRFCGRKEFGEGGSWGDEEWRMWKL
jgi:hypothetical protein